TALVDIRLPDLDGYTIFRRLREIQPLTPIILMTGFGYDPTHSIVKARQDGLQTVLYKPFRSDRLMEAVEQALRANSTASEGHGPSPEANSNRNSRGPHAQGPASSGAATTTEGPAPPAVAPTDGQIGDAPRTEVARDDC
ncbi:MAG: response regulator, partial [Planctomycetaceae bacterium]|nr:response regulator [Planctomycetaceae bacterium]